MMFIEQFASWMLFVWCAFNSCSCRRKSRQRRSNIKLRSTWSRKILKFNVNHLQEFELQMVGIGIAILSSMLLIISPKFWKLRKWGEGAKFFRSGPSFLSKALLSFRVKLVFYCDRTFQSLKPKSMTLLYISSWSLKFLSYVVLCTIGEIKTMLCRLPLIYWTV